MMRSLNKERNFIRNYSTGLAAILVFLGTISTPTQASSDKQADSSNEVPVHMVVTVKPRNSGGQVPAVGPADVKVYQRDRQNMVTSWVPLQGDRAGLQLFILIDDTARASLGLQLDSIKKFIEEQPETTAIGVGYMRNGTVFTVQNLTKDHAAAAKALRLPLGGAGSASPYLSISDLMKKWPVSENRREILMITSGIDPLGGNPFTNPYLSAAIDRAQQGGFIVYSIYTPAAGRLGRGFFRGNLGQTGLDMLGQKTGGTTYYLGVGTPVDLSPYLQDVSFSLKHQYELTFLAKSAKKPTLEPVKVKTEMPNIGVIAAEDSYVGTGM
ncbi:MAG: hypothetical protein WCC03_00170 [Candidatus Acidiferrales bacterium]